MQKRNFLKFILVGLLTVLAGEFQVNVLVFGKKIDEYFSVLLIYAFLLALMYLFGKFFGVCDAMIHGALKVVHTPSLCK